MMQHRLDTYITKSVFDVLFFKVGPTWERKMVKGYMASGGITAGDKRVGRALSVVSPLYQVQRNSNTARQTNGPCVIRPFHFQFRKKMKFYFLFVLFMNSSRFFEAKLPYCRKNTDMLTTKLKILFYLT